MRGQKKEMKEREREREVILPYKEYKILRDWRKKTQYKRNK